MFKNESRVLFFLLFLALFLRFITLGAYELHDTTEARYAGIGMRMVMNNDYLTPWFLPNVPFLGKPPLSFWATALSFKIFGSYGEFFARLPHFLIMLATMFLGYRFVSRHKSPDVALKFALVFASCGLFFILSGSVMTDAWLTFAITLTNISFFEAINREKKGGYGYVFFVALAISVLSKGLTGIVISGFGMFFYVLIKNKWRAMFKNLPIITGLLLMLAIIFPWFFMMERAHPGFMEYFILGEHFKRFLVSGWEGDRFGTAHEEPLGMIWAFFAASTLPWFFYIVPKIFIARKAFWWDVKRDDFLLFCVLFMLSPLVIFTFAHNIIMPYAAPALLPFAIIVAMNFGGVRRLTVFLSVFAPLVLAVILSFVMDNVKDSDKKLIAAWNAEKQPEARLIYLDNAEFSSYFYSRDAIFTNTKPKNGDFIVSEKAQDPQKFKEVLCIGKKYPKCLYQKTSD